MPRHLRPAYDAGYRAALAGADYFTACPYPEGQDRGDAHRLTFRRRAWKALIPAVRVDLR